MDDREQQIVEYLHKNNARSSKEIWDETRVEVSYSTLKRILAKLLADNYLVTSGKGRGTKYMISPAYEVMRPVNTEKYFAAEIDEREIKDTFDLSVITEILARNPVFTEEEHKKLFELQEIFKSNLIRLSQTGYQKEMERLAIDLSWKSSQIEGNTYSLLETERLLKEKEMVSEKPRQEAVMLLNVNGK